MSETTVRDGRMLVQFYYEGGPWDGEPFEFGPGAIIPDSAEAPGLGGIYEVDEARARFTWQPAPPKR